MKPGIIDGSAFQCFYQTVWANELETNLRCDLIWGNCVDRRFDSLAEKGCTIKVPFLPDLPKDVIQDLSDNVCGDLECYNIEGDCCDIVVDKFAGTAFTWCDPALACQNYVTRQKVNEQFARAMAEYIECDIITTFCEELIDFVPAASACNPEPAAGDHVIDVDLSDPANSLYKTLVCCSTILDVNCVPRSGRKIITTPKVSSAMALDPIFTQADLTGKIAAWCRENSIPSTANQGFSFFGTPILISNSDAMYNADGTSKLFCFHESAFVQVEKKEWDMGTPVEAEKAFRYTYKMAKLWGNKLLYGQRALLHNVTTPEC